MKVRPLHPALYLLGLGHRLSPIGLGRVVTVDDPDATTVRTAYGVEQPPPPPLYTGDGPSLGWVTERLLPIWIEHDRRYRAGRLNGWEKRWAADELARHCAARAGRTLARYRLAWWLATPLLVIAWRYRWGGWQDLPGWLWWSCLAAWAALWCSGWAGLGLLIWSLT